MPQKFHAHLPLLPQQGFPLIFIFLLRLLDQSSGQKKNDYSIKVMPKLFAFVHDFPSRKSIVLQNILNFKEFLEQTKALF